MTVSERENKKKVYNGQLGYECNVLELHSTFHKHRQGSRSCTYVQRENNQLCSHNKLKERKLKKCEP